MPNDQKPEWQKQLEDAMEHYDELIVLDRADEAHSFMAQFVDEMMDEVRELEASVHAYPQG